MSVSRWSAISLVARNDLRLMFRDRGTVFWSFVGPFAFILAFGFIFGARDERKTQLTIANLDRSKTLASALSTLLGDEDLDVKMVSGAADSANEFVLVVPAAASDSFAAERLPHLVLRSPYHDPTPTEQNLRAATIRALLASFFGLGAEDVTKDFDEKALRAKLTYEPSIALDARKVTYAGPEGGFQHTVPAYLVMFLLLSMVTGGAEILVAERRTGQLRRALVSSTTASEILLGKFASRFAFAWLQILVILGVGFFAFHVRVGLHPGALFAALTALAFCGTGLGLLFASFFDNPDKAGGLGALLVMVMAALGGCWWPLEIVPAWMRKIAFLLPTGWGYDALKRVMTLNYDLAQIAPHLAVLCGIAIVALPIAVRRFARQT
jgi:ABC-type multidrug transport system permease subunit